jgi:alpha-D-xyloside xylohydrolase
VVQDWDAGAARYKATTVALRKGQVVKLGLEYYQGDAERTLRLAWRTPSERQALNAPRAALDDNVDTYLPKGADWYDFWTNQRFDGGRHVSRRTPLDLLPLYVRAGSIVPMGPQVQYATQAPQAPYEVRIYPGANARFTLYEDDNETYAYEKGAHATYDLVWNDAARTLSIGARRGGFPGMTAQRELDLVLVDGAAKGGMEPAAATKRISYTGDPITVRF